MKDAKTPPQIWFKFFPRRYLLGGSLRIEAAPDERAVWLDFLCLANDAGGSFDCADRDALATQLFIPQDLLERAIKKFIATKRLSVKYDKREKKEIFTIVKWAYYQNPYKKSPPIPPSFKKDIIEQNRTEQRDPPKNAAVFLQKDEKDAADFLTLPEIPEHFSFAEKEKLRDRKAEVRHLERLFSDDKKRQSEGYSKEELKNAFEKAKNRYIQMIEDRT